MVLSPLSLLGRLAGVAVTAKRAERGAKQGGREIAAWERPAPALVEPTFWTCSPKARR